MDTPLRLTVWYDVQCPYSDRVLHWLAAVGGERVAVVYRAFPLEQVNRDPTATEWRIWEQPLDYEHYRGRQDRRSLLAFLASALLAQVERPELVDDFRRRVSTARHTQGADVSDLVAVAKIAAAAGAPAGSLERAIEDPERLSRAREWMASDWWAARAEYEIFGVPTLQPAGGVPFYLRLASGPTQAEGHELFESLFALRGRFPLVVELKEPVRTERLPIP